MKNICTLAAVSFVLILSACADPAANKPKAQTAESVTNSNAAVVADTSKPLPQASGTALAITPDNSKIEFTGSKVTGKHDGGFESFTGSIDLVDEKPEASKVSITIDTASIFSDADGLTKHLMTADFFDVANHPKSTFTSTRIVSDSAKGAGNYTVTGDLELRGVKKAVTFPAKIEVTPAQVAVNTEFSINRKDFQMAYAGKADDLIRDDVVIRLDLKTSRK